MADIIVIRASQQLLTKRSSWGRRWKISIHLSLNFNGNFTENVLLQQNSGRAQADLSGNPPAFPLTPLARFWGLPRGCSSWPPPPLAAESSRAGDLPWGHPADTQPRCFGWGSRGSSVSPSFLPWSLASVLRWQSRQHFHGILCCPVKKKKNPPGECF